MGGSLIQNATSVTSTDFTGYLNSKEFGTQYLVCTVPAKVVITGTDLDRKNIKRIKFTLDSEPIYIEVFEIETSWEKISVEKNKIELRSKKGVYYRVKRQLQATEGQSLTLKGTTENITQGTVTETYTSSFPLTEIDDLREYILSKGREEILCHVS